MTAEDDRLDAYLTDPNGPPVPQVQDLERRLAPLRFDVTRRPLEIPPPRRWPVRRIVHTFARAAAAVVILALTVTAYGSWRWTWTAGAPWAAEIDRIPGAGAPLKTEFAVDRPLQLSPSESARIDIARIGTMRVTPGSAITLAETMSARHRVVLDRGTVSVRIWAPPGMFAFRTPSGSVRDLGCVFDLAVDADGTARVRVDTGWVQMDNDFGESLVPAGTSAIMRRLRRPGVPVYDDSSEVFAAAVRQAQDEGETGERRELDTILRTRAPARRPHAADAGERLTRGPEAHDPRARRRTVAPAAGRQPRRDRGRRSRSVMEVARLTRPAAGEELVAQLARRASLTPLNSTPPTSAASVRNEESAS